MIVSIIIILNEFGIYNQRTKCELKVAYMTITKKIVIRFRNSLVYQKNQEIT